MADVQRVAVKRRLFESASNSSDFENDFDSDDSIIDRDYSPEHSSTEFSSKNEKSPSPDEIEENVTSRGILRTPIKATPSRWRKTNIECRKKHKAKTKRNLGHVHESSRGKLVMDRKIGPPCQCTKKCREQLLQGREANIFSAFWDLGSYKEQNTYLFAFIKAAPKKRSYKKKTKKRESSRKVTYQYFVKVNGMDTKICKQEFLSVHGLQQSSKRVRLICKQISEGRSVPKYLFTYNLGVHDCVTGKGTMFMWTENTAKRGSEEIASILLKYLCYRETTGQEELIVYTDNCGGQNKNWLIMSLWLQLVREKKFKSIEHRFLISGHTYLPCDRDFALIEKHKRFLRQVYCPEDWYDAVLKSKRRNAFEVIVMQQEHFFTFDNISMARKTVTEDKEPLNFNQVPSFRFESDDPNAMFVKHEVNGSFKRVNVGRRESKLHSNKIILNSLKQKYDAPVKLNIKKVADLRKLLQYIPLVNQNFYLDIFATSGEQDDEQIAANLDDVECVDGDGHFNFEEDK